MSATVTPLLSLRPELTVDGRTTVLTEYRTHLLAIGRGAGTVAMRLRHIEALQWRYGDLGAVGTEDLERVLARGRFTLAAETRKSMLSSYRVFFAWAARTGRLPRDVAADLASIPIPVRVPRVAPDIDVRRALVRASSQERAMILLARMGCLRLSELTTLHTAARRGDSLRILGKGEKERLVFANDDLLAALLTLEREQGTGYYFPGRYGGHMHVQSVNKIIQRCTGWNPHSLRHAGATAAYNSTRDLRGVQEMLGHSSMATTQRYLHLDEEALRRVAAGTAFAA